MKKVKKMSLFARIFGKKYFIKITDDLKEDEILVYWYTMYIPNKEEGSDSHVTKK